MHLDKICNSLLWLQLQKAIDSVQGTNPLGPTMLHPLAMTLFFALPGFLMVAVGWWA